MHRIHVFNIAYLPKEIRNQFTSDFKVVADYFAEKDNPDYQAGKEKIRHVEEVLDMLRVFTGDERYDKIKLDVTENKQEEGEATMDAFLDKLMNKGIEQGMEQRNHQVICNMLRDDLPVELISKYTGCSAERINQIRKEMLVES